MKNSVLGLGLLVFLSGCRSNPDKPLFPAPMGGRWGYIDEAGHTVIKARFENVRVFSNGLAAVAVNGRWGYIDRTGKIVIPALHRSAQEFHGGVAIVDSGLPERPYGLMNSSGVWVIPPSFRSLSSGDETGDLFLGMQDPGDSYVFFDKTGERVLGPYESVFPFHNGRARVGDSGWIDVHGVATSAEAALDSVRFSDGLIAARKDKKLGYMDVNATFLVEPAYDQGGEFSEGLAPVEQGGRWFLISSTGGVAVAFPETVRHVDPFSEGRAVITVDRGAPGRKLGYTDRLGRWTVPPEWDDAEPFHNGRALVGNWRTQSVAYIDPNGKVIWRGHAQ